jgi:hypothetical protein
MIWIAASEKDTDNAALEKRLWDAADQLRAPSPARDTGFKSDTTRKSHARTGITGLRASWPRFCPARVLTIPHRPRSR